MKIRLDQVDEPFVWKETMEVSSVELDLPELVEVGAIECRGEVRPMAESYLLQAALSFEQKLRCMRCLQPVTVPCSGDLDLILEVGHDVPPKGSKRNQTPSEEQELEQEDLGILRLADGVLDTRPILIEQIHLSIPMKPLCKEDCAGLCADCGADLNAGPCGCKSVVDPRWQALAAMKRSE